MINDNAAVILLLVSVEVHHKQNIDIDTNLHHCFSSIFFIYCLFNGKKLCLLEKFRSLLYEWIDVNDLPQRPVLS